MIKLYNTASKQKEDFIPIKEKAVGIYSCGPTVYHYQHLGNMRASVFADTLHRMFLSAGYNVKHVINITDVGHLVSDGDVGEDKMEKGAKREGKSVWEVAKMYTDTYFSDLSALNVSLNEYIFPRATDHIREQIALVKALEIAGYTYKISDGIYFDTSKFKMYADFAHLDIKGLQSGARVEENEEKKNITDFALWKFSYPDGRSFVSTQDDGASRRQMEWESPWGIGFPGWHIECSAMSMKYLGEHFDIHTGGIEHIPVHHTNEIAQSKCVTGMKYANYWMHNNHLLDTTGKMSKSSGEFLTISTLKEKGYDPLAYRYFLLTAHYKKELAFSFEALDASAVAYKKLTEWCKENKIEVGKTNENPSSPADNYKNNFLDSLYDDLGTPACIALMWDLIKDNSVNVADKYKTIIFMGETLGLPLSNLEKIEIEINDEVKGLLEARASARLLGDYTESDHLRDEIAKFGFIVKDTSNGQELGISQ